MTHLSRRRQGCLALGAALVVGYGYWRLSYWLPCGRVEVPSGAIIGLQGSSHGMEPMLVDPVNRRVLGFHQLVDTRGDLVEAACVTPDGSGVRIVFSDGRTVSPSLLSFPLPEPGLSNRRAAPAPSPELLLLRVLAPDGSARRIFSRYIDGSSDGSGFYGHAIYERNGRSRATRLVERVRGFQVDARSECVLLETEARELLLLHGQTGRIQVLRSGAPPHLLSYAISDGEILIAWPGHIQRLRPSPGPAIAVSRAPSTVFLFGSDVAGYVCRLGEDDIVTAVDLRTRQERVIWVFKAMALVFPVPGRLRPAALEAGLREQWYDGIGHIRPR